MTVIFDALPGIDVPVDAIAQSLARMWDDRADVGQPSPATDDVKATQVNFVLHYGFATTPDDAQRQFHTAVRFSTRYPSRVVVLCPLAPDDPATEMRAKIYGECFLGRAKSDARCCEFVLLCYPMSARDYLESQVSVCLSPDLPLYYWAHRFSECARLADYEYLLTRARRFLFDTAVVPAEALTYPWPNPAAVRDLALARTLPVRQSVGQFLSRYEPARLIDGLRAVTVTHDPTLTAEGQALLCWAKDRLGACHAPVAGIPFAAVPCDTTSGSPKQVLSDGWRGDMGGAPMPPRTSGTGVSPVESSDLMKAEWLPGSGGTLKLRFDYSNRSLFRWCGDVASGAARFEADFGSGRTDWPAHTSLLEPEMALGEAMFF
jgi:hypothetical protein